MTTERREKAGGSRGVLLVAFAALVGALCFTETIQWSSRLLSGLSSSSSAITPSLSSSSPAARGRRLQDEDGDDEEASVASMEESASDSFDPEEDAGVEEQLEAINYAEKEAEASQVDLEQNFEEENEKAGTKDAAFALQEMKMRLKPRGPLDCTHVDGDPTSVATKQFAHLHHMKTGGTSINRVVNCAVNRARDGDRDALPFYSLSECGWGQYKMCTEGTEERSVKCRESINSSAVMQYCAPLFQMDRFGWLGEKTDVITTLRNPVDRVWSMFRFQTRGCYHCTPLLEVYKMIDDGTIDDWCDDNRGPGRPTAGQNATEKIGCEGICITQLLNHQTRNLMTTQWESPEGIAMSDQEKLDEALHNLRTNIAVVGITEELPTYRDILGQVFPWLAEEIDGAGDDGADDLGPTGRAAGQKTCALPHANASPKNNRCGKDGRSHWDLPDEPDDETREAILRHNLLDMELYLKAKERFQLQKRALGLE
eukprot:CAMPEP_0197435722 /NCGR_PEP_ID=MMETSP1175-20131217/3271_1 /TAXON_ID=1003142 /ORGANISM="Triceratium dubium, Strain CCMP147" /LENGTH=483 /DNA_ID=CAMNT_0042964827 /DNA_START=82 /DNA_END=1533 /DNA_ORIENTATION=+